MEINKHDIKVNGGVGLADFKVLNAAGLQVPIGSSAVKENLDDITNNFNLTCEGTEGSCNNKRIHEQLVFPPLTIDTKRKNLLTSKLGSTGSFDSDFSDFSPQYCNSPFQFSNLENTQESLPGINSRLLAESSKTDNCVFYNNAAKRQDKTSIGEQTELEKTINVGLAAVSKKHSLPDYRQISLKNSKVLILDGIKYRVTMGKPEM